jgi:hypothetical protein
MFALHDITGGTDGDTGKAARPRIPLLLDARSRSDRRVAAADPEYR